ncbi:MAG TPA: secretion system protein E, partial [Roseiflexaceae bacterium]
ALEAIKRADRLLASGEAERSMSTLRSAWGQRRDGRLMLAAQKALAQAPHLFTGLVAESEAMRERLEQLIVGRNWVEARQAYEQIAQDVAHAAAAMPTGGWERMVQQISAGLQREQQARAAQQNALAALKTGQARAALDLLNPFVAHELDMPSATVLALLRVRAQAMQMLVQRGEGSQTVLDTLVTQLRALEQELGAAESQRRAA